MTKFEEEFNYLIELSGKVLLGQVDAETFEKNRIEFFEKYETDQQQSLPVVPECVAELFNEYRLENIQRLFEFGIDDIKSNKMIKALMWRDKHPDTFSLAFITGKYEVEKPQLFYLKNKLTGLWLMRYEIVDKVYPYDHTSDIRNRDTFTQQEIDSMQTGSYEQIEVAE
ncbi:DUF1642 domain-containing protein [Lactococcus lactis subsp. cremoris]|nr:DUF1642 domain-containing protein [Lactococcus cremoris]MRM79486.1 DUF1642 domain-containing protein [Lactococcus cremoris]